MVDIDALVPPHATPEQLKSLIRPLMDLPGRFWLAMNLPAMFWWVLLAIALAVLARVLIYRSSIRYWYKMKAFRQLDSALARRATAAEICILSENLLKRLALHLFPDEDIKNLHGKTWASFLISSSENNSFPQKIAGIIAESPYLPEAALDRKIKAGVITADQVASSVRAWIEHNL